MGVQREIPGQTKRGCGSVDARSQTTSGQVRRAVGIRRSMCGVIVGGDEVRLSLPGDGIRSVHGPLQCDGWQAGHCRPRAQPEISGDRRRACVGDRGASENGETVRRPKAHGGLTGGCCRRYQCGGNHSQDKSTRPQSGKHCSSGFHVESPQDSVTRSDGHPLRNPNYTIPTQRRILSRTVVPPQPIQTFRGSFRQGHRGSGGIPAPGGRSR
jgi:hypothetical protein